MKLIPIAAVLALGLTAVSALAGYTQPAPLIIDLENNTAGGDMLTARYSKDDTAIIGCGTLTLGNGYRWGFCQATNEAVPDGVFCQTENPLLIDAMGTIDTYSYVSFSWENTVDENGNPLPPSCTRVRISTQSMYLPRKLDGNE